MDEQEALLAKLPAGRHGLPRDFVDRNRRTRILLATAAAIANKNGLKFTIADIAAEAHVSRRDVYDLFEDKFDAAATVVAMGFDLLAEELGDAPDAAAAIRILLAFLEAKPNLARVVLVEGSSASPAAFVEGMAKLAELVGGGLRGEFIIGAAAQVLRRHITEGPIPADELETLVRLHLNGGGDAVV